MDEREEGIVPRRPGQALPAEGVSRADADAASLRELAMFGPRLAALLYRLMKDRRVPARTKATLLIVGAYVALPVDLVPDVVPGLGQVDDLVLVAFALDQLLNRIPDHVVREHWDGDEDVLEVVRNILDISTGFIPAWLKRRFAGER